MKENYLGIFLLLCFLSLCLVVHSQSSPDAPYMQALKTSLGNSGSLRWADSEPCGWKYVTCSPDNRVTMIQIRNLKLEGSLPPELGHLSSLIELDVGNNQLSGPIPSLAGLNHLRQAFLDNNNFSYIPADFFKGLTSLNSVSLDYNPFSSWEIPESLKDATGLQSFSANGANISGTIPDIFGRDTFPELNQLHLAMNNLHGQIPSSFSKSSIQSLWLNGQNGDSKLNGSVSVLQNMTALTELLLHGNAFTGPLPDASRLTRLKTLSVRDNQLTGIVPLSLINHPTITAVSLTNNLLQGPTPQFDTSKVNVDLINGTNRFCLDDPGKSCGLQVNILLSIVESMGYPVIFAQSWKGDHPCDWKEISCEEGNITVVNFTHLGLTGTISSNFSMLVLLKQLILSNNSLTGTIPNELTALSCLEKIDVSNNQLYGRVPNFPQRVVVITSGNRFWNGGPPLKPFPVFLNKSEVETLARNGFHLSRVDDSKSKKIVGIAISAVCVVIIIGLAVFLDVGKQMPCKYWELLRNATNNFSEENILGRGGFGTVYKGELQDGTKIAVKRMKSGVVSEQGFSEFMSEIEVLTKVRHCHLVTLLGYCLDGNERLLVYEYMPQGSLSRHLFSWKEQGLNPLDWTTRLTIALDVARGVEYLHCLAHQSFIHRDLKPFNILLGDDMRAKVADFGLARLVPDKGGHSVETRLVGTLGYLAPEYIVTGRVTTKVDVFSFGVILMELITGKKAIDPTLPDNIMNLVPWFRRMHSDKRKFPNAIDQTIELDKETLASVSVVADLADHCCTSEPYQRPDMKHAVNVLSSLSEFWMPVRPVYDDIYGN